MEKLISFIIPAHNAASTIENCVASILVDSDEITEIIIVENGSTDNTLEVVKELADKNERIKVVISEKGVSNARNKGIEVASGKYISFVDADDRLFPNALECLITDAQDARGDLIIYGHKAGNRIVQKCKSDTIYHGQSTDLAIEMMLKNPTIYMSVWGKLFNLQLVRDSKIFFNKDLVRSEDSDFVFRYSLVSKHIYIRKQVAYDYCLNNQSVTRKYNDKICQEFLDAIVLTSKCVPKDNERILKSYNIYILMHINLMMVRGVYAYGNSASYKSKKTVLKNVINERIVKDALNDTRLNEYTSLPLIPILLIKLGFWDFAIIAFKAKAKSNYARECIR